ncbi:MAG: ABC transporter permease [Desulfobacterium sp.]
MKHMTAAFCQYSLALLVVLALNFLLIHMMPGDPLVHILGEEGYYQMTRQPPAYIEKIRETYQLNDSLVKQFLTHILRSLQGDLGWSHHHGMAVSKIIYPRMGWTLLLLIPSVIISTIAGGTLGALAGGSPRGWMDRILTPFFLLVYSIPGYCLGLFLLILAFHVDALPMGGMPSGKIDMALYMMMPMGVLILHSTAYKYMIMKNAVIQEIHEAYVMTARSKGLNDRGILFTHVVKNALPPFITVVAMHFGFMMGGSLVVEMVFSWQGMGTLIYDAVISRDYPLISGSFMIICASVILANALADVIHGCLDPRIRSGNRFNE